MIIPPFVKGDRTFPKRVIWGRGGLPEIGGVSRKKGDAKFLKEKIIKKNKAC